MIPVSDALKELLCRHGMSAGSLAGDRAHGMDAGLPKGERTDPLADAAHREEPRIRSGMEKAEAGAPAVGQELVKLNRPGGRGGVAFVVHTNHAVPTSTRKRTQQVPFLVVVT